MGTHPRCSEDTFVETFEQYGPAEAARILGVSERNIHSRRRSIENRRGFPINAPGENRANYPHRFQLDIKDGTVLIGSDAHLWPNYVSTAWRAFVMFARSSKYTPDLRAIVLNGDVLDFPQISRHPPMNWEHHPTVEEEITNAQAHLAVLEKARRNASLIWTLGNHDARFEARLAQAAHEFAKIHGIHLKDHFPCWQPCWRADINNSDVVIKHRFKGGRYAPANNTLWAGVSMVTGHLHAQQVIPHTDVRGTRYGVDAGCLADPEGPQFLYTEDNPLNWRSGFVMLTFRDGYMLPPELITRHKEGQVTFRGQVIDV